jgi:hypothetical protein
MNVSQISDILSSRGQICGTKKLVSADELEPPTSSILQEGKKAPPEQGGAEFDAIVRGQAFTLTL